MKETYVQVWRIMMGDDGTYTQISVLVTFWPVFFFEMYTFYWFNFTFLHINPFWTFHNILRILMCLYVGTPIMSIFGSSKPNVFWGLGAVFACWLIRPLQWIILNWGWFWYWYYTYITLSLLLLAEGIHFARRFLPERVHQD